MAEPTVVVIPPNESRESSPPPASDGANTEIVRLAQEAAQATESNRQVLDRLSQMEAGREADRQRIESLEIRNRELIAALEEEEEDHEEVTVVTPPDRKSVV